MTAVDPTRAAHLRELAQIATDAEEAAHRYAQETPEGVWNPSRYSELCARASIAERTLRNALNPHLILSLLDATSEGAPR